MFFQKNSKISLNRISKEGISAAPPRDQVCRQEGFTLIEVVIAVAIIGILAAIAYPSYQSYVLQSRRAEAMAGLLDLQQDLEKWRVSNPSYAGCSATSNPPCAAPPNDHYNFSISNQTATTYTITATPKAGSPQASDTKCYTLRIDQSGNKTSLDRNNNVTTGCWKK